MTRESTWCTLVDVKHVAAARTIITATITVAVDAAGVDTCGFAGTTITT